MVNKSYSSKKGSQIQYEIYYSHLYNPNGQCQILLEPLTYRKTTIKYSFKNKLFTVERAGLFYNFVKGFYKW